MAKTLDDATLDIASKLGGPPQIDPAFLFFLKELLMEFLPLLLEMCQETVESAPNACKDMLEGNKPGRRLVGVWKVRRFTSRRVRKHYGVTPVDLLDGMLEAGAESTPRDFEALYNQC